MDMLNHIASYWNEFLLAGVGFLILCLITMSIGAFLIYVGHKIIGTVVALMGTLFGVATKYALIVGIALSVIKIVLKMLVGIG